MHDSAHGTGANPYRDLPARAFWRSGVAERGIDGLQEFWQPKFPLTRKDPVATYGSCFAQHIGRGLEAQGLRWLVREKPPRATSSELARAHGYGLFSARTGNIYTPSLLLQWLEWAFDARPVPDEVWPEAGGLRDPFRPRIEPAPFESARELEKLRRHTLKALRQSVTRARLLVFTLGLTERWVHAQAGHEYPLCPGTAAGRFDPAQHRFAPLDFAGALDAMTQALDLMRAANPELRFLLTVSPVPLAATAQPAHVLCATSGAKAVLRAVAGQLAATRADTDYFPSLELITSPIFGGRFFAPDQRQVTSEGVAFVMQHFFAALGLHAAPTAPPAPAQSAQTDALICEEELLDAFGPPA